MGVFLFLGSHRVAKSNNTPIFLLYSFNKKNSASVSLHPHCNQKYSWLLASRCKVTNIIWFSSLLVLKF